MIRDLFYTLIQPTVNNPEPYSGNFSQSRRMTFRVGYARVPCLPALPIPSTLKDCPKLSRSPRRRENPIDSPCRILLVIRQFNNVLRVRFEPSMGATMPSPLRFEAAVR